MFGAIGRAISRPIRGIGRVVRGIAGDEEALRKGIGDIGHGVKVAAPFIPGLGTVASIGMGALGSAAERLGKDDANLGTVLGSALKGGAQTGVAHIGKALAGKGLGAAGGTAGGAAPAGTPGMVNMNGMPMLATAGQGATAGALPSVASAASSPGKLAGIGNAVKNVGGRVKGWAEANPELAGTIAGGAADAYGAHQLGRAQDREFEFDEEQYRTRQQEREEALQRIMDRRTRSGR